MLKQLTIFNAKCFLAFVVFVGFSQSLFSQVILEGKVSDYKTQRPIPYVNVYINNTTVGTTTNLNGEYSLPLPLGESEVIFSFVGFNSNKAKVSVPVPGPVKLDIKLVPSQQQLDNVTVEGSADKEWERLIKRFEKIFLGDSYAALQCKILNRWCIDLKMKRIHNKRTLVATASQPIEIENMALGYKLLYDLQKFEATDETFAFSGYVHFKEIETSDSIRAALWMKNRLDAYHGSSRHIFKSLLERRLDEEGISLYAFRFPDKRIRRSIVFAEDLNNLLVAYNPTDFQLDTVTGNYIVPIEKKIEIHYQRAVAARKTYVDVNYPVAEMTFREPYIQLNKDGILLTPWLMTTTGYLNMLRAPYLIPYDYHPEKRAQFVKPKSFSLEDVKLESLQEKVYLHTDKPYYYAGEVIWFKGYLKYQSPDLPDSMSRVLYVDLISPDHQVLNTKIFQIDSGRVQGDLKLPGSLPAGNYYLRAYTNWMRNYDDTDLFIKALPILGPYDNVENVQIAHLETTSSLTVDIKTHKETYLPRDSINLTITLKDEFENPVLADLSISITDIESVTPLSEELNIVKYFTAPDSTFRSSRKEKSFYVEYGISLEGQFKTDKGKPKKAKLTIIQGNLDDMVQLETNEEGYFWISGFQFFDSTEFAFRAIDDKRRKLWGKVWLSHKDFPIIPSTLPVIQVPLKKREYKYSPVAYNESDSVTILNEVTIEDSRIEEKPREFASIGNADRTFDEEFFKNSNRMEIMLALEGHVPGLRLIWGIMGYEVRLGGGFNSLPNGVKKSFEPLLVVDGVPDHSDATFYEKIQGYHPSTIKRVEVYQYGSSAVYGMNGANGVIAIYTNRGNRSSKAKEGFDKTLFQLESVHGFTAPKKFKSPSYGHLTKQNSLPDYRSTIYWEPWLTTTKETGEANVSFYAADLQTKYRVVVEGVTSAGEPIHSEMYINISR